MQHFYYYKRDEIGRPVETVCVAKSGDAWARGFAACCDLDNPCKRTGRKIAKQRAEKSLEIEGDLPKSTGFVMARFKPEPMPIEMEFVALANLV